MVKEIFRSDFTSFTLKEPVVQLALTQPTLTDIDHQTRNLRLKTLVHSQEKIKKQWVLKSYGWTSTCIQIYKIVKPLSTVLLLLQ